MKKLLCALLVLLFASCCGSALAEQCKYGNDTSPCEVKWWVDTRNREHARACFYHVEEKSDMNSHVLITAWEACTPDEGGKCTTCGYDYIREPDANDYEKYMLEYYYVYTEMMGKSPVNVDVSDGKITITLDEGFFEFLDEMGVPYGESLMVGSELTLSPVNGAFKVMASEYGPLSWLEKYGKLSVGSVNITDGVASANVVVDGKTYNLTKNVGGQTPDTPDEEGTEYCKYGSASSPCDIRWDANGQLKQHSAYCVAHVEDKEDMYSYVQVTDWEDCTLDANQVCTICGADYAPDEPEAPDYDADIRKMYYKLLERNGVPPLEIMISENHVSIKLNEQFIMYMLEYGIPVTDEIKEATVYTLTLPEGTEYPYEGRPVFPTVSLDASPNGPGAWLRSADLLYNDSVQYENNQAPGTASAKVVIHVDGMAPINLAADFTIVGAVGERCKYYAPDSPCDVIWWVDGDNRMHCRACRNHVEDKEDMYSYVQLTDWAACTLDEGGECTTCGWDYVKEPDEDNSHRYMLEYYMMLSMEMGSAPVNANVSGNQLTIGMHKDFFTALDRADVAVSETMMVETTYTLTLPEGSTYAATGEAITPAVAVEKSAYGPGSWFDKVGLMDIGEPVYTNNVEPGTATVSVDLVLKRGKTYTLIATFTIEGEAEDERVPGDISGDACVDVNDAIDLLEYLCGEDVDINAVNADVTGDGKVDLQDVLRILQYDAGWNVTLK